MEVSIWKMDLPLIMFVGSHHNQFASNNQIIKARIKTASPANHIFISLVFFAFQSDNSSIIAINTKAPKTKSPEKDLKYNIANIPKITAII